MLLPLFGSREDRERIELKRENYFLQPKKFDGFDDKDGSSGLAEYMCDDKSPCSGLVTLYAMMGLHRYNLLQGTNLQLSFVKKYNMTTAAAAASYYITLVGKDPPTSSLQAFQIKVTEQSYGKFILTCYIARPRGETKRSDHSVVREFFSTDCLPEWPSENPFERFYVLKKSELRDNYDWILLYLKLAVGTTDRSSEDHDLSKLKIVKVAMDTTEDANDGNGLNAKNVIFCIRYKDSCEARVGKDVDRIAIVRRAFNEQTGCFSLVGRNQSSDYTKESECTTFL